MFEKLLANLPYNPDLTKQISFYAHRVRREEAVRRTGLVFIVLAFMLQFFAFISPPQSTTAYSSSDMINGGISSKADAVSSCRNNVKNFGDVLWNFKITCNDLASATATTVRSTDFNGRLFSMSWLPYGQTNPRSGKATDETPYNLAKVAETIYARRLTSADTIPFSTYRVLEGTSSSGRTFFIMFDCGNLMFVGVPNPVNTCRNNGTVYYAGDDRCLNPVAEKVCPFNINLPLDSPKCKPCKFDNSIPADSKKCVKPCPYNDNLPADSPRCKPCKDAASSENALACIVERKTANNPTKGLTNANNTTAQPNDVIVYTLFAENKGKAAVKNFVMQENLNDVLDYATVVSLHGGSLSSSNLVKWPAATIKAGSTLAHRITVRVKNPLPTNTPPAGDPGHFDRIMTNVYGNAVNIRVPSPTPTAITPVVTASEDLPNTGPGTGLLIAGAVVVVAAYFFARARLLVDESMIVIQQAAAIGGKP